MVGRRFDFRMPLSLSEEELRIRGFGIIESWRPTFISLPLSFCWENRPGFDEDRRLVVVCELFRMIFFLHKCDFCDSQQISFHTPKRSLFVQKHFK